MIKKYSDFIKENLEFILESNVVFSDNFRKAMTKIDHPMAKAILGVENNDITVQANYLDIEFSKNDTITFTPDRKAQKILGDTKEVVRFTGSGGGWLKHKESNNGLFEKLGYTFGVKVCIEGTGIFDGDWTVQDRMNARWVKRIDFLVNEDVKGGKWNNIKIEINEHQ